MPIYNGITNPFTMALLSWLGSPLKRWEIGQRTLVEAPLRAFHFWVQKPEYQFQQKKVFASRRQANIATGCIFLDPKSRMAVVLPNRHHSQIHFKTLESSGGDSNWQKGVTLVYLFYTDGPASLQNVAFCRLPSPRWAPLIPQIQAEDCWNKPFKERKKNLDWIRFATRNSKF